MVDIQRTFNRIQTKRLRKYFRNNSTSAERILWRKLRASRLNGFKFRRQCGVQSFIVDFYCPELKLAIEIDGDGHALRDQKKQDTKKTDALNKLGIKVMRFTNIDIHDSIEGVLQKILSNHPLAPSLTKEGEPADP